MKKLAVAGGVGAAVVVAGYCGLVAYERHEIAKSIQELNETVEYLHITPSDGFFSQTLKIDITHGINSYVEFPEAKISYGLKTQLDLQSLFHVDDFDITGNLTVSQLPFSKSMSFTYALKDFTWEQDNAIVAWKDLKLEGQISERVDTLTLQGKNLTIALPYMLAGDIQNFNLTIHNKEGSFNADFLKYMDWDEGALEAKTIKASFKEETDDQHNLVAIVIKGSMKDPVYSEDNHDDMLKVENLNFELTPRYIPLKLSLNPNLSNEILSAYNGGNISLSWDTKGHTGTLVASTDKTGRNATMTVSFDPESVHASAAFQEEFLSAMDAYLEKEGNLLKGTFENRNGVFFVNGQRME